MTSRNVLTAASWGAARMRDNFSHVLGVVRSRNRPSGRADWITADDVGRVATALSANPAITSRDVQLRDKGDVALALEQLALARS